MAADCGENTPPQCKVLAACKSEAAISLQCAAGICTKANPKCFVTLLSSNPVSISGYPINRIRKRLKVGTGPAHPREQVLRGQMQPPPAANPHALPASPKALTTTEIWGGQSCRQSCPCSASPREAGAVSSAPCCPSTASVLLMDEVNAAPLSEPFMLVPAVSQKCSGRKDFP